MLSKRTERVELKRRGILAPDWSEDEEDTRLAIEQEGLEPEFAINPVDGEPLNDNGPPQLQAAE